MVALEAQASENPRVRVAALILNGNQVSLVRHRKDGRDYFLLPGGGVERGESLADALRREVAEETGLSVTIGRPLFINDTIAEDGSRHLVNITFLAHLASETAGMAQTDARVVGMEWLNTEHLSNIDLRPPLAGEIARFIEMGTAYQATYLGPLFKPETESDGAAGLHKI